MQLIHRLRARSGAFRNDLSGAFLAAIIGLPMGLAFGVQSGLGAEAGLYTAIVMAIVASVFGGTKTLITDPTGPMTVVAATVVALSLDSMGGDLASAWPLIVGTFVLAGLFQTVFGAIDLGRYVKYMPYPVLSGFMAGIGVIIISVQLFPLLGHASPKGFVEILSNLGDPLRNLDAASVGLGILALVIIYGLPRITKAVPSILIALIVCTVLAQAFSLGVPVIGEIPTQLPSLHIDALFGLSAKQLPNMIGPALMLAALGTIDSLLTSVVADNITKTKHDSRLTIIGQGLGNMVAGLFGGIPGAGATMGTVTNIRAGASTRLSGIMKGVFLLVIVVGVADYVRFIPNSVLAAILISIGIGIVDYKGLRMLVKVPKGDALVWATVLLVTIFDNLLNAVAIGFALSGVLFISRTVQTMSVKPDGAEDGLVARLSPALAARVHVCRLDGPLFFGFADQFRAQCAAIHGVSVVVVRLENVPFLDQSGLVTLEAVVEDWASRHMEVHLVGANPLVSEQLHKAKLVRYLYRVEECFARLEASLELEEAAAEQEDARRSTASEPRAAFADVG